MTKCPLALFCVLLLPLSTALAQNLPPPPNKAPSAGSPEARGVHEPDENFALVLTPAGKSGEGLMVIVTSAQTFNVSRSGFTFNGTLARAENGALRLDYLLETNAERGGIIHTGSSVLLRPGEPVQLVKNGDQFYDLRLDRYPPPDAPKPAPAPGNTP